MTDPQDKRDQVIQDSVQSRAHESSGLFGMGLPGLNRLRFYRQKSDLDVPPYGYAGRGPALRRLLRVTGAEIAAACQAVVIQKVQATSYEIEGPQRTVGQAQRMLDLSDLGNGFSQFLAKWVADFCTQDNGAPTELLGPGQPVMQGGLVMHHPDGLPVIDVSKPLEGKPISLGHMDSVSCERTGVIEHPVRYYDINGGMHLMHRTRVHLVADMPQPDERLFGYGFCALSRCISAVQYAVNLSTMRNESLDSMPPLSIMVLGNINQEKFEEQMRAYEMNLLAQSTTLPGAAGELPVLRTLMTLVQQDPTKPVNVNLVPIRQLWESFNELTAFQWLVNTFAMGYGLDPQELAPLASTAMGSGAQSSVLDQKARGKGVGNILSQIEEMLRGILPASVTFRFDRRDDEGDQRKAAIRQAQAGTVLSLYTGRSGGTDVALPGVVVPGMPTADVTTLPPSGSAGESLLNRGEARRLLLHEIPEWGDVLDPDMVERQEVAVDELDPDVALSQTKMYGPRVRYNSKAHRMLVVPRLDRQKASQRVVAPVTDDDLEEARQRLAAIGIKVDELRANNARS